MCIIYIGNNQEMYNNTGPEWERGTKCNGCYALAENPREINIVLRRISHAWDDVRSDRTSGTNAWVII